ncbi:2-C-methyl-D-erythritol 2,4-cyclodiphosphate synthase [Plasmodium falciparum Santa Lucia]|uniref:2-C-methyl-D-erythritol 2,4-cyclodiphosphate synthase, apicoplast n=12 Tax=Plasmodium falciparum TaxID=5833 RepID=ISPF_PLAF7|nr:2C-methyl-D-erythritol 2,4-cyclodiphosphate synthase [Plasmodium falciparum 3D7]P62368.1 RecName: Full=2-C-methyl-D-erythritol 2,4-cyclodiphosphate synthase, apicoplast; Short=MECDP-synthase; Short=MECPS; AltName: Full=PfIspF; Flags: Precursor [Plasmodium falciparum 3D7]P62369.1 RecName: Full=2-C-methyl-D-erythritol 2,4-cyclodiphosphate synthase, apicoplast; Short=MECDP-synthase; Short=MECPS; Flags: Precursor [Plasmodium falciparum HB3]AAG09818.1 2C-Methyl-D-erythritol 2,4-cyclodiphosphate sy|eukprot:XP_001349603.1 2C-methyl-D-erythritol 2,4-cyclodiphosphate synthase [Plasmodium falciparum 3D7]
MFLKGYTSNVVLIILTFFILLTKEEKNIKNNISGYCFLNFGLKKNAIIKKREKQNLKLFCYNGIRIGQGYDIHKIKVLDEEYNTYANNDFNKNEQSFKTLTLGGVKINNVLVLSHSDGDIIYHSIVDSILGALGSLDIGTLFPDKDEKNKNKNSAIFLRYARLLIYKKNYDIGNVDINVIAQVPKISNIRKNIIKNISTVLNIDESQISVKGKTHEKLGVIGEKKAIECFANILLIPKNS